MVLERHKKATEDLLDPWTPSPMNKGIVQMWESACPTMLAMLKQAGIQYQYAEMLLDEALDLARRTPGEASAAQSEAMKEVIPAYEDEEREWIQANSLNPEFPDPDAETIG